MESSTEKGMETRIREARERAGFTQEEIAEALDVSRQAVSKWEAGTSRPSTDNLIRLAKVLGTDLEELTQGPDLNININIKKDSARLSGLSRHLLWLLPAAGLIVGGIFGALLVFILKVNPLVKENKNSLIQVNFAEETYSHDSLEETKEDITVLPESLALSARECYLFDGYPNYGEKVDASVVEAGLLFQYRFRNTSAILVFYTAPSPGNRVDEKTGAPLLSLYVAYELGDGNYTSVVRLVDDEIDAGDPQLSAFQALGYEGCKITVHSDMDIENLAGCYYFILDDKGIPQMWVVLDEAWEADIDSDGENEIIVPQGYGEAQIYDRGVNDYISYKIIEELPKGSVLSYGKIPGTDGEEALLVTTPDGSFKAYRHLWNGKLMEEEVLMSSLPEGLDPDVAATVLVFIGDQFSDGADPDLPYQGRGISQSQSNGQQAEVPTHRQLAYMGLQTLYDLTGIRVERCYVLATEFNVNYAMEDRIDSRSFFSFSRGAGLGGGELAIGGFHLTWKQEKLEWSVLDPDQVLNRPENGTDEQRALWAYDHAYMLQEGEIVSTGYGLGEDVRLFLEDGRFFEVQTDSETGLPRDFRGPYPPGFEH